MCVLTIFPEKGLVVRGFLTILPSGVWQAWDWSDWVLIQSHSQSVLATLAADLRTAALRSSVVQYFLKLAPRIHHQERVRGSLDLTELFQDDILSSHSVSVVALQIQYPINYWEVFFKS